MAYPRGQARACIDGRQRSAMAHNIPTTSDNLAYAAPEKRTVARQHRAAGHLAYA